jgi:hypothetical protein
VPADAQALDFREPTRRDASPWRIGVEAGGRWRAPGFAATEVATSLAWGPLALRASLQPPTRWELFTHTLEVEGLSAELGVRAPLSTGRAHVWQASLALAGDRLALRPLYRPDAPTRIVWDVGVAAGSRLSWLPSDQLGAGLSLGVQWMPTARFVRIGSNGPEALFNSLALRAAFELHFGR